MSRDICLETERLTLKTLGPRAARKVFAYQLHNRGFLSVWEPDRSEEYYTLRAQRRLLMQNRKETAAGRMLSFWIFSNSDDRIIGNITFSGIIRGPFLSCFLGYKLDVDHVRQGYMTEALKSAVDYMFREQGLHRIEANILPENRNSCMLAEKLGFRYEGTSPDYLRIRGIWREHCRYVLINDKLGD